MIQLKNYYVASLSGGKDSLYMFRHILANLDRYPLDAVVHFEMPFDYPWVRDVITYVSECCEKLGIPCYIIKPKVDFYDMYNKYGYPTRVVRWCNKMKTSCSDEFRKMFKDIKNVVYYIGLCANEEKRVKDKPNVIYPLYEMGVFEETIWEWAKNVPLFNNYYKYNKRQGCMYCPMQDMKNSKYNSVYYPNQYDWYMNLAKNTEERIELKKGKPFSVWHGNPKYNTEYRRKRIEQMEIKEIERW